jgi:hypothetical protein
MWPFTQIGAGIGDAIASAFDSVMTAIWNGTLDLMHAALALADQFSVFTVSTSSGPIKVLWPMMLWVSGVLAMVLFFWQLIITNLRAGRGFLRLIGGPVQYGVALAVTVGLVATFLAGVDGLTAGILNYGLRSKNFTDAFSHTTIADAAGHGIKAVVLGLCAIAGLLPAAVGYVLEMLFREAAVYVLVGVVPVVAAGLLADITANWFWLTVRWLAAAIAMEPVLALTLVLGVAIAGGSQGVAGLLAGIVVLLISLVAPFVLFRLFAFVDPRSDAGGALRDYLSSRGVDSYGLNNPASIAARAGGGSGAIEEANADRFDEALAGQIGASSGDDDCDAITHDESDADRPGTGIAAGSPSSTTGEQGGGEDDPPPPNGLGGGDGGPRPDDGGGGPQDSGPEGGAAAGEVEEAAVIL